MNPQVPQQPFPVTPAGPAGLPIFLPTGGGASAESPGGLTPRDIMQILRKRIWLIVILVVLFTGASMTGTYFWIKYAPSYTAAGAVQVHSAGSGKDFDAPAEGNVSQMAMLLMTHAQRIMNHSTLALAAQDEELRNTKWAKGGSQADIVERLKGIVRSAALAKTQDIRVSATTRSADDSATVVNAVMRAYIEIAKGISQASLRTHIDQLEDQKRELSGDLDVLRLEIERHQRGSRVADLSERSSTKRQELMDLNRQAIRIRTEYMRIRAQYDTLLAADQQGTLLERPEIKAALYQDPVYGDLLNRQTQLISQMQIFQRRYGPSHSSVSETEDQLNRLAGQLAEAQRADIQSYMDRQREAVESLSQQLLEMEETVELVQADVRELFTTLAKLHQLKLRESDINSVLNKINTSLQEARFVLNVRVPVSLTALATAPAPTDRSPKYYVTVPAGFVLGAIMGLALTALLEVIDTSIKRPSDVRRRVDLPLLGIIPHVDDLDEDIPDPRLAVQLYPDSPVGEAFRQVRTRLIFSSPPEQQRTLLITSPLPEDGRTMVTANLGATLAQFGSKVLLVDANFRQPILHELFQGCPFDGLSNALVQRAAWGDLVHHVSENLHVLAAGPLPPNPAELLSSKGMLSVLAEMGEQYDHVLFDSGPCLVVTDPAVLASRTDGVLLVLRAGANTHGVAQKARSTMTEAGGHILGAVLNGVRVMAGGYLRKNYDTFYEYRERQPALPA